MSTDTHYARITRGTPGLTNEHARRLLRNGFGLTAADLRPLAGETDRNLHVTAGTGEYVLKVCPATDRAAVDFQAALLRHIAEVDPDLPVPRVVGDIVEDGDLLARMLTWLPGTPLAEITPRSAELLADIGATAGRLATATGSFTYASRPPSHYWEFPHAAAILGDGPMSAHLPLLDRLAQLPQAVVHHDLNALNLLITRTDNRNRVSGVIDFGDAVPAARIADLAILASSVARGAAHPLRVIATLTAAYHSSCPLTESELDVLFGLIAIRTATVAATTARLAAEHGHGDPRHRSAATAELAEILARIPNAVATTAIRQACGLADPTPTIIPSIVDGTVLELDAASEVFDNAVSLAAAIQAAARPGTCTRYGEPRFDGTTDNVQLGIDVFTGAGEAVATPEAGVVERAEPDLIVRHPECWRIYNGLDTGLDPGDSVAAGNPIGRVTDIGYRVRVSVVPVSDWDIIPQAVPIEDFPVWRALFPNPGPHDEWRPTVDAALRGRKRHLPETHPTYYQDPAAMVRARDCWFYDEHGRSYLDALNNVTLLGHGPPRIVEAAARQLRRLNTNSRFVYDVLTEYAAELTATLPDGLEVVYFLNSGSEANDLALRMARHVTGRPDVVIIDDAYHGYTATVADVSPSRYKHYGKPETTHPAPVPDRYRGPYGYDDPDAGAKYARQAIDLLDEHPPAAFLFEALLAGAGQIVLPPGYLPPIFAAARRAGVLTIADEVQVGFGRLGEAFWGFQIHDVVPDIVTMGKAMGNGFPVAALVTTREISRAFDSTGRFFSTYGGNPVACAVGLEVLHTLAEEGLQRNALEVGQYLRDGLAALDHELIGDVRGQGFYSGVELVKSRAGKEPAAEETLLVCERLKDEGILVYPTGPQWNVLKLKPPLTFTRSHADEFVAALDRVLRAGW